jgi:hypothetical protein
MNLGRGRSGVARTRAAAGTLFHCKPKKVKYKVRDYFRAMQIEVFYRLLKKPNRIIAPKRP